MKKEKSRNIWSSLLILSAAKLKIFQNPVAVDVRRRGRRQGALWEIKRIASKQPGLSTLLLQIRFSVFICNFRYEKKNYEIYLIL